MTTKAEQEAASRWLTQNSKRGSVTLGTKPSVDFYGRFLASFGTNPDDKQRILDAQGISGTLRDPPGFDFPGDIADLGSEVAPAALGLLGGIGGSLYGGPAGMIAGETLGAGTGRAITNIIGDALGADQGLNPTAIATDMALGAVGGGTGALLGRAASPLGQAARTAAVEEVGETAARLKLDLPADAITESRAVAGAASRSRAAATKHGDYVREKADDLRQRERDVFEDIATDTGVTSFGARPNTDTFLAARDATKTTRLDAVGELFEKANKAVPNPETLAVVKTNTIEALNRMLTRSGGDVLPEQQITAAARANIKTLRSDAASIDNFKQLDTFRKLIGKQLDNKQFIEELRKSGGDVDLRDVYGGIARDLEESLDEGLLARVFGQKGGTIGTEGIGRSGVNELESLEHLANKPASEKSISSGAQTALKNTPAVQSLKQGESVAENILDSVREASDAAKGSRTKAADSFVDVVDADKPAIIAMLKDPAQAENLFGRLFTEKASVQNIRDLKTTLGATETAGGATATQEGTEAIGVLQGQMFRHLREASEQALATSLKAESIPLSGNKMVNVLKSVGGKDVIEELLGRDASNRLSELADFLRRASPTERPFTQIDPGAGKHTPLSGLFDVARRAMQATFDGILRTSKFPQPGWTSSFLTKGASPQQQNIVRALGSALTENTPRLLTQRSNNAPQR